jgi:hypothetical protein
VVSGHALPTVVILALFALLPMAGELTTWAKNAINHSEWTMDPAYYAVGLLGAQANGSGPSGALWDGFHEAMVPLAGSGTALLLVCAAAGELRLSDAV